LEFIIKPLSRYQGAFFPIFGGFLGWPSEWGGPVSGKIRYYAKTLLSHLRITLFQPPLVVYCMHLPHVYIEVLQLHLKSG